MGAPARLAVPDPSQQQSSLASPVDSIFSPSESESGVSSSLSSTDSTSSSFTRTLPYDGESARKILAKAHHAKKKDLLAENVALKNERKSKEARREGKQPLTSYTSTGSVRKACCRCAGAFAADCAAVCCCPCALLSFVAFILVELPSAVGRKMVTHLKKRRCIKDAHSVRNRRGEDSSHTIFTPSWSCREPVEGDGEKHAVSIIRFDTQNLLKHFEAEHVGFGCLSLKRGEMVSDPSER